MRMTTSCLPAWRKQTLLLRILAFSLIPGFATLPVAVSANPSGANVVHGAASFDGLGTGGLTINQTSSTAIINWQNFSIGAGEWTQFVQPGSDATAINRVVSGNPSAIYGSLSGNGNVMVINPNGIVVGATGVIDVAGAMTLSTLDASNSDLLDGGSTRFLGGGGVGVTNYGAISAGDVIILGDFINNAGRVVADRSVAIGAGGDILVNQTADGATISVRSGGASSITNSGDIAGGNVDMKAHGNSYAMAINNSGAIRAKGFNFKNGVLTLRAGNNSSVVNTGSLYARQEQTGQGGQINISGGDVDLQAGRIDASGFVTEEGGEINVQADRDLNVGANALLLTDGVDGGSMNLEGGESATLGGRLSAKSLVGNGGAIDFTSSGSVKVESTALIDVSGMSGGDTRIGGGFQGKGSDITNANDLEVEAGALILADGVIGDAGEVILWSDEDTLFYGEVSAQAYGFTGNGGFVEVSGKRKLTFDGLVSTLSNNGRNGTLLLDPADVTVGGAGADVSLAGLTSALATGDVIIHTSGSGGTGVITIGDHIDYSSSSSLTLLAHHDIAVGYDILNHGSGNVNLFAGWDGTTPSTLSANPSGTTSSIGFAELGAVGEVSASGVAGTGSFGAYGVGSGDVVVQPGMADAAMRGISVASRDGETNVFGDNIFVMEAGTEANSAGNSAQIGYRDATQSPTGSINVFAKGSVLVDAATRNPSGADVYNRGQFAMIGHGGSQGFWVHDDTGGAGATQSGAGDVSGDIKVYAPTGTLMLRGGGRFSHAQIGHGGYQVTGAKEGDVSVEAGVIVMRAGFFDTAHDIYGAHTQIGHGGYNSKGVATGDVSVISHSSILGRIGEEHYTINNNASTIQIGHGGWNSGVTAAAVRADNGDGNTYASDVNMGGHTGAIFVEARSGDIDLMAGFRNENAVQIGHGGYVAHGNHSSAMVSSGAQQSGAMKDGITVSATGSIVLDRMEDGRTGNANEGSQSDRSFVQIGNGGGLASGRFTGAIDVDAGGNLELHAGNEDSYAQVGHGGRGADAWNSVTTHFAHGTLSGDIDIDVGGDLKMRSGWYDNLAYSMIGHGGVYRVADKNSGHNGNITLDVAGEIDMAAGALDRGAVASDMLGNHNFTMIGHGGWRSTGDHWGDVTVNGGKGLKIETFIGYNEFVVGDDRYTRWSSVFGQRNFGKIGHGGYMTSVFHDADNDGDIGNGNQASYLVSSDQIATNSAIGLGIGSRGSANISVNVQGDINLLAAQTTGALHRNATDQTDSDGTTNRPPVEWAMDNFVQIGHGGTEDTDGDRRYDSTSVYRGDIEVVSGGKITVKGGGADASAVSAVAGDEFDDHTYSQENFAKIGHGGYALRMSAVADVDVAAAGDVELSAGIGRRSSAVIGHGGYDTGHSNNDDDTTLRQGDITVLSGGSISLTGSNAAGGLGGSSDYSYAQIGMDGVIDAIDSTGDITVAALADVSVLAGSYDRDAYAQIGHGGVDRVRGDQKGTIDVTAGQDVILVGDAGTANENSSTYSKIGHGSRDDISQTNSGRDRNLDGATWEGDIYVKGGRNVSLTDGFIGHIDDNSSESSVSSTSGDTYVAASRLNPDFLGGGSGDIIADANSGFSSAGQGFDGQLRLYMPNRIDNQLAAGAVTLNGRVYSGNPATAEAMLAVDQRGDENLDFYGPLRQVMNYAKTSGAVSLTNNGVTTTSAALASVNFNYEAGSFAADSYAIVNGLGEFYQLYYNNVVPEPVVPEIPTEEPGDGVGDVVSTPEAFDYADFIGEDQWETYDWPFGLLEFDGYGTFLTSFSAGDMVDSPDAYVPRSGLEEALDGAFGRRRWTWRPGAGSYLLSTDSVVSVTSDLANEQSEDRARMNRRAGRGAAKGEMNFFLYEPGTNRYSSLRLFGYPVSDVPAFESGE